MRDGAVTAIKRAALELFSKRGFHAASIADIARRARVAKGLIYNYFPSKDELLVAIIRDRLRAVTSSAAAAPEPATESPPTRLRNQVERATARALNERDLYRVYFGLLLQPDMAPVIARVEATLGDELRAETERVTALFNEVSDRPELDATLFQMALNGLAFALLVRPELADRPELFPLAALQERLVTLFQRKPRTR
jgi:AcrR family transcriptional regulator